MLILLDMDMPLADSEGGFLEVWRKKYPRTFYVPAEKRTSFYPTDDYPQRLHKKLLQVYRAPGFFLGLPPVAGALEAAREMLALGIDVRVCTSPFPHFENCVLEKYLWIERYLGREFTDRIILTRDKTLVRGHFLIDDKPVITGALEPAWEHIIFDAPYNRHIKNKKRLNWSNHDWRKILNI